MHPSAAEGSHVGQQAVLALIGTVLDPSSLRAHGPSPHVVNATAEEREWLRATAAGEGYETSSGARSLLQKLAKDAVSDPFVLEAIAAVDWGRLRGRSIEARSGVPLSTRPEDLEFCSTFERLNDVLRGASRTDRDLALLSLVISYRPESDSRDGFGLPRALAEALRREMLAPSSLQAWQRVWRNGHEYSIYSSAAQAVARHAESGRHRRSSLPTALDEDDRAEQTFRSQPSQSFEVDTAVRAIIAAATSSSQLPDSLVREIALQARRRAMQLKELESTVEVNQHDRGILVELAAGATEILGVTRLDTDLSWWNSPLGRRYVELFAGRAVRRIALVPDGCLPETLASFAESQVAVGVHLRWLPLRSARRLGLRPSALVDRSVFHVAEIVNGKRTGKDIVYLARPTVEAALTDFQRSWHRAEDQPSLG